MLLKGEDLYDEMRPILVASKLFGVAPFRRDLRLSILLAVYSVVFLAGTAAVGAFIGVQMERLNGTFSLSLFSLVLERFQALVIVATIAVSVVMCFWNGRRFAELGEGLAGVDSRLASLGLMAGRSSCLPLTLGRLLLLASLPVSGFVVFHTYASLKTITIEYICFVPLVVANMVQGQFITLLALVTRRLLLLTRKFKKMSDHRPHAGTVFKFEALASIHGSLVTFCEVINSMYSPQILIILSSIFIITTANLYHVIDKTVKFFSGQKDDFNVLFIISCRILVRSYEVWALIASAVNTSIKVREFNICLHNKIMEDSTQSLSSSRKLRLHISMKREVIFTACGFFNLDYTLIHSMIAAATTYLVILIQFGPPTPVP